MNKKVLFVGGGALAVVAIVVALFFIFMGGEDAYRSIKVFEIDGSCKVERGGDSLDAFKNMALSSGDSLTVGEGSFARLKLDDDKYVYLEANTKINLTATGTANDSKTMVYIERGSMLTEVKKKLSATSSYDIVTPNTTMSIRGTKTLTEVYEDVLGAIKTNAAVVEGQVSFKTIQKDSTGKAVIVTTDLSVGQGLGVTTDSKDLLSQEDVKHIADDGKTVDGQTAEETTHEELGTTLETPVFSEDFLTNIVAVLARSREEDIEEGFAAEDVTEEELNAAINILNDVIDGKVELPAAVEEYVISQTQPYYDEPIYDTPVTDGNNDTTTQPQVENESEQIADDTVVTGDSEDAGDDTFVVDGTGETLVGIGDDADDNDATTADDESDDEADAADDEADDEIADDGSDEAEEDDKSDEGDDAAEDGDEEDTDDESDEDDEDKEDAEETEDEDKEEESEESEDETEEQQEETAVQQPGPSETDPNTQGGSGTGTGTSGTSTPEPVVVTIGSTSRDFSTGNGSGQSSSTQTVTLKFINTSNSQTMSAESVSSGLSAGDPLPGLSDIGPYTIELMIGDVVTHDYEFTGWYSSQEAAQNYDSDYLITTVPSAPLSIFPGIRAVEVTYTVRFVNIFPEAGSIVAPGQNYWNGLTYTSDNDPEAEWIEISGIHYGDTIYFPMTSDILTYENTEVASRLHIETNFTETALGLTEYAGIGIGTKGSDGILRGGDDVNLARILLGDTAYIASRQDDFVRYETGIDSNYRIPTEIRSDMTFYLYFSTNVTITVPKGGSTPVRMLDADGTADTRTVLERYGFNYTTGDADARAVAERNAQNNGREKATHQLLKLRTGDTVDKDQYWGVFLNYLHNDTNGDPIYVFETYFFGKPLEIPSFAVAESKESLYDLSAKLILTGNAPLVPTDHIERTYVNTATSGYNALTISRTSPTSSWLFGSGVMNFSSLGFELEEDKFVTLDLSESGVSENIGLTAQNLIRKHRDSEDRTFRLRVSKKLLSGGQSYYNAALIPEDDAYEWSTGGRERTSPHSEDDTFAISKDGMRLAGFSLVYYNPVDHSTSTQNIYLNANYSYDQAIGRFRDGSVWIDYIDNEYVFKLGTNTEDKAYTVKPIFIPDGAPFTINLVRPGAAIVRPDDSPSYWALSGYKLEISGLDKYANNGRAINKIDLTSLVAKCYTSYTYAPSGYYGVQLNAVLKLEQKDGDQVKKYYLYKGDGSTPINDSASGIHMSFEPQNGTIAIPLAELGKFKELGEDPNYYDAQFVWGIDYDVDQGNPQNKHVAYYTTATGDLFDCGTAPSEPERFSDYKPFAYYIDPVNAAFAYTAVFASDAGGTYMPQLVFSEFMDTSITSGSLLEALTGYSGDDIGLAWYGGEIRDDGLYGGQGTDAFPWTVTRSTSASGSPEIVVKGGNSSYTGKYGSGVLKFDIYKYLYININPSNENGNYANSVRVYSPVCYNSSTNTITADLNNSKTLQHFYTGDPQGNIPGEELYLDLELSNSRNCPDGWADITKDNDSGYIYYGDAAIDGKAKASLSTFIPH